LKYLRKNHKIVPVIPEELYPALNCERAPQEW